MNEGFYRLEFVGIVGAGHGLILLDTGREVGCDTEGGLFDGSYKYNK